VTKLKIRNQSIQQHALSHRNDPIQG